jgi:hypothetical protein
MACNLAGDAANTTSSVDDEDAGILASLNLEPLNQGFVSCDPR